MWYRRLGLPQTRQCGPLNEPHVSDTFWSEYGTEGIGPREATFCEEGGDFTSSIRCYRDDWASEVILSTEMFEPRLPWPSGWICAVGLRLIFGHER